MITFKVRRHLDYPLFTYYIIGKKYPTEYGETCGHTILKDGSEVDHHCFMTFPRKMCPNCEVMEPPKEHIEFMKRRVGGIMEALEEIVKKWNREVVKIQDSEEYSEAKRELLEGLTLDLKTKFEDAMRQGGTLSFSDIFGIKCEGWESETGTHYSCGRINFWKVTAYSDIPITPRKELEVCPKCGKGGSKYVDKRGYVRFYHYERGERRVCYIGKPKAQE